MRAFVLLILILVSIALMVLILLQQRGSGAGSVFGGGSGGGEVYRTRRGMEKSLHYLTIGLAIIFSTISVALIFIK